VQNKDNTYALITGASSGIGLAFAERLAQLGHNLFLVSNQKAILEEKGAKLQKNYSIEVLTLELDLAEENSAQNLFQYAQNQSIEVDILINNAGVFTFSEVVDTAPDKITQILYLHVFTTTLLCRLFAQQMLKSGRQCYILNMSSLAAWMAVPSIALYSSTKAYLRHFSRTMHEELYHSNVSLTVACPGGVATNLYGASNKILKTGLKWKVLSTPQKSANCALKAMFKKKKQCIGGSFINKIMQLFAPHLPHFVLQIIKKKCNA
jgi:short-subunit dehydrogenase